MALLGSARTALLSLAQLESHPCLAPSLVRMPPCTIIIFPLLPEHLSRSQQAETEAMEDRPSRTTRQARLAAWCRQNTHSLTAPETVGTAGLGVAAVQTAAMACLAEQDLAAVAVALHITRFPALADAVAMDWWCSHVCDILRIN